MAGEKMINRFHRFIILSMAVGLIFLNNNVVAQQTLGQMDKATRDAIERRETEWNEIKERISFEDLDKKLIKMKEYINEQIGNEQLIFDKLGKPKFQNVLPTWLGKDGLPIRIVQREFVYDGLNVYLLNNDSKEGILSKLIIKKNNPTLSLPVKIGMNKSDIIDYLGSPVFEEKGAMHFYVTNGKGGAVIFKYHKDNIIEILFDRLD